MNETLSIVRIGNQEALVLRKNDTATIYRVGNRSGMEAAGLIGRRVTRGPDWCWGNQGGLDARGTVTALHPENHGWVHVAWDEGDGRHCYRWGAAGCFDLRVLTPEEDRPMGLLARLRARFWKGGA